MGKKKKSSTNRKPPAKSKARARTRSAPKPVKKAAPKPRTTKQAHKRPVVKKPSRSPASSKGAKPAAASHSTAGSKSHASAKETPATSANDATARLSPDELRRQLVAKAKSRTKSQRAVAFTLDDVRGELAKAHPSRKDSSDKGKAEATAKAVPNHGKRVVTDIKPTHRRFGAASLADILGYNPAADEKPENEEASIDKKFLRFYKLLVQLRDHVKSGLALHAEDTLKRSSREDAGDLSGYGQHMADAGTDAFDRDFALSLVSNEQEALFEIEEAIKRIKNGTYGVCELTGKPIAKERLLAVPFARYSVESQAQVEKTRRRTSQRAGLFGDAAGEEGAKISEEDSD